MEEMAAREEIEKMMAALGAVRVPPEDDDFERWLDEMAEYDPATKGWYIEDGVVHSYPRTRRKNG
jgi:hypothetical protein